MTDWVIETQGLRKQFRRKTAVADLTLTVGPGEVFGFLGPNGAGKSTAVKMLLGLVRPSGGTARVLGHAPGHRASMARIGFLPEHFRFHTWMTATELLRMHSRLYGLDHDLATRRIAALLDRVGLSEHARRPISGFSKGMVQRLGLAQALLAEPRLVFLDEPTSALDPLGRRLVRTIIHDLKAAGTTVFLNSHLLGEVEATCDRVAFIKEGRVLRSQPLDELEAGRLQVEVRVDAVSPALLAALDRLPVERRDSPSPPAPFPRREGRETLPSPRRGGVGGEGEVESEAGGGLPLHTGTSLALTVADEAVLPQIAEAVLGSGARLYALTPRRPSLEQIFLEIVGAEDSGQ